MHKDTGMGSVIEVSNISTVNLISTFTVTLVVFYYYYLVINYYYYNYYTGVWKQ